MPCLDFGRHLWEQVQHTRASLSARDIYTHTYAQKKNMT